MGGVAPDDVTAVLVTRGDQEDAIQQIIASLIFDEVVVWNNASPGVEDAGAYGRYLAAYKVVTRYVYLQDDDAIVSAAAQEALLHHAGPAVMVSNMDPLHNGGRMPWLALPGWGAVVEPGLLEDADRRWREWHPEDWGTDDWKRIGCDIAIPTQIPSAMVDVGHHNLQHAYGEDRTWRSAGYAAKKSRYYELASGLRNRLGPVWNGPND